jgi:hypothetical protein
MNLYPTHQLEAHPALTPAPMPQQANEDPYFSVAINVTAGPLPAQADQAAKNPGSSRLPASTGAINRWQDSMALPDEVDIRGYQDEPNVALQGDQPMPIRHLPASDASENGEIASHCPVAIPTSDTNAVFVQQNVEGEFLVGDGNIAVIDGNEGYDYIDLSDRDIANVSFRDSSIVVFETEANRSFTIRYQNVDRAMFADGIVVTLN